MRHLLFFFCTLVFAFGGVKPAGAQIALPGLGGDAKEEPAVRLAEDPRQELERIRKELMERQQGLLLRAQDANDWAKRQLEVRARKAELVKLRGKLVRTLPPTGEERAWQTEETYIPEPEAVAPDAGPPDAGVGDGGVGDGGVGDGQAAAVAADAGVPDAVVDAAPVVDAGPPKPMVRTVTVELPILTYGPEDFLSPGIHPAEAEEVDGLIKALDDLDDALAQMQRLHTAERTQVSAAVARAEKLAKAMDEAQKARKRADDGRIDDKAKPEIIGLQETEARALAAHLARIEVSLARAQHRQSDNENEQKVRAAEQGEAKPVKELELAGVEPVAAFVDSHGRAVVTHAEAEKLDRERDGYATTIGMLKDRADRARQLLNSLELKLADQNLNATERAFNVALEQMVITRDELEWAQATFDRSVELRSKSVPKLEAQLDKLRRGGVATGDDPGRLTADEVRDAQQTLVSEELTFERMKLARDEFRRDMAIALKEILSGGTPDAEFVEHHRAILDPDEIGRRLEDKKIRCDGWRRAQNTVDGAKAASPAAQTNKDLILKAYLGLADLCMREEWVLDTQERLAEIARFHLKKLEWRSRGFVWFSWRIIVSLCFLAVVVFLSRWIGHVTRLLARRGEVDDADEKVPAGPREPTTGWRVRLRQLRGVFALVLYVGGVSAAWLGATVLCVNHIWGIPLAVGSLLGWATYPIVYVGEHPVSLWSLLMVFIWTMAAVWLGRPVQNFMSEQLLEHFQIERGLRDAAGAFARYFVIFAGVAGGLASVGIGLGSLAVIIGVLSLGIGFGLQNIVANFISGFILLLERPIRKGDFIRIGDMEGEVMQVSARATIVETRDAISVIVPNSDLISEKVINLTKGRDERIRLHIRVGVAYGSDLALVEKVMLEVARKHKDVLRWPAPAFRLTEFADSSLNVDLNVWTLELRNAPTLISDLNLQVDAAFRANGITIPFPQRDLHIIPPAAGGPALDALAPPDSDPPDSDPPGSTPAAAQDEPQEPEEPGPKVE